MKSQARLVRIYIDEGDRWHGKPLADAIVARAQKEGLSGATVMRGVEGFGAHNRIHSASILRLAEDLPVVIEIVDEEQAIQRFLPFLDEMITEGLVLLQDCEIVKYGHVPKP